MKRRRRNMIMGGSLLLLIAGVVVIWVRTHQTPQLRLKFDQIECGMTRTQVQELMRDIDSDLITGNSLDAWENSRYTLIVEYRPDSKPESRAVDSRDSRGENLIVEEVILIDSSEPNPIQKWLHGRGWWSSALHKECK